MFFTIPHKVIPVVVPHGGIGADRICITVMLENFFSFFIIFVILKTDLTSLRDRSVDDIGIIYAFTVRLIFAGLLNEISYFFLLIVAQRRKQLVYQLEGFFFRNKLSCVYCVAQHFYLRKLHAPAAHKIFILRTFIADNIVACVSELFYIRGDRVSMSIYALLRQFFNKLICSQLMIFICFFYQYLQ